MSGIEIPIGVRIAKFKELTPDAQQVLMNMIKHAYVTLRPNGSLEEFREGVIELLECGEAYIDNIPGKGLALKLHKKQSDLLI